MECLEEVVMIKEQVSLYFQQGSSDKEYHAQIESVTGGHLVNFQYGRRGSTLKGGTKTKEAVTIEEAAKIYEKLVKSKMAKGYSEGEDAAPQHQTISKEFKDRDTGEYPNLLDEIQDDEVVRYINDDNFFAQEKHDGERRMAKKGTDNIGINKKGQVVPLVKDILDSLVDKCFVDAEDVNNHLFIFDLLRLNGENLKSKTYEERLDLLESLAFGKSVTVTYTARTKKEKLALYKKLKKENREGIVFKRKTAVHKSGRGTGDTFKNKFYKTTTCRVADHTKGVRSVGLEMLDGTKVTRVGKATIYPNHDVPAVGSYVEIKYLYAYKGGSLYQPIYLGERNDQDETDINLSQLVYKAE